MRGQDTDDILTGKAMKIVTQHAFIGQGAGQSKDLCKTALSPVKAGVEAGDLRDPEGFISPPPAPPRVCGGDAGTDLVSAILLLIRCVPVIRSLSTAANLRLDDPPLRVS
jgi:hypothetical protein